MMDSDIKSCLESVDWCRADYEYFRGGGFSSHFKTMAEMPVTMLRINLVDGVGPTIQIAEGYTVCSRKGTNKSFLSPQFRKAPHSLTHATSRQAH